MLDRWLLATAAKESKNFKDISARFTTQAVYLLL